MSTWLILNQAGVVVDSCVGQPVAAALPADWTARDAATCPAGAGVDWFLVSGVLQPPGYKAVLSKADLVAYAAAKRFEIETGGITMPDGTVIKTDRESQALINGAKDLAKEDPDEPIEFKNSAGGFTVIDSPTMLAVGLAVGRLVRDLFKRENAAQAAIAAGTATTTADVDRILSGG